MEAIIYQAILDENLYLLDDVTASLQPMNMRGYVAYAIQNNKARSFLYFTQKGYNTDCLSFFIMWNNFAMLKTVVEQGYPLFAIVNGNEVCYRIIKKWPSLEVLQFCHQYSQGAWGHKNISIAAAASGNVSLLRYCFSHGCTTNDLYDQIINPLFVDEIESILYETIVTEAAASGNLDCLKYAIYLGAPINYVAVAKAAQKGHLHIVKYLVKEGCVVEELCTSCAAYGNQLKCLKYLVHTAKCPMDINVLYYASKYNNTKMFNYAIQHGCPKEEDRDGVEAGEIVNLFAENRNFLYVRKAIRLGLVADANTMEYMIDTDDVHMLAFCYKHYNFEGRPHVTDLDVILSEYAAKRGSLKCLKFIFKNKFVIRLRRVLRKLKVEALDLEDIWYRHLFFNRVPFDLLQQYPKLLSKVHQKKEYLEQVKQICKEELPLCKDVVETILFTYV